VNWWRRLLLRGEAEEQLEKELRFHLDQFTADLIEEGYDPREARRKAFLTLGSKEQVKEQCRDARGTRWLEDLIRDVAYAFRTLRRRPGFAVVTLLTLGLGTGATTAMFTLINGVLLKPLPYPEPERLAVLQEKTEKATRYGNLWAFSYPNFVDCERESHSLLMAAWRYSGGTVVGASDAQYLDGEEVSSELFSILGAAISPGRDFLPEEDRPGAQPVIIISNPLWQRLFGGSPSAVGTSLVFEGKPYTIVGIAPAGFRFPGDPDVFTLIGQDPAPPLQNRQMHPGINVWARLQPRATMAEAQSELALIGSELAQQYPASNAERIFVAEPLRPSVGDVRSTLWLLFGAVSLVLLIACVNVASLLVARAVSRERELAIRLALGAGRSRLVRQCLTESAVLGFCGGVLGFLLAALAIRPFVEFWPGSLPRAAEVTLDWHVQLFAFGVSLLSGFLFGLAPALRFPDRALEQALRAGARAVIGSSRPLHAALVASEIALAIVLLVAAGMLGRTIVHLSSVDPGLNVRNILVTRMALSPRTLQDPAQIRAAWQDILDRARRVPGVQAAATVDTVPMREGYNEIYYWPSPDAPPLGEQPLTLATSVSPDYLQVMGIPLRQGRFFNDQDRLSSSPVVVIDDTLAERAFAGQDPIGRQLWIPDMGSAPVNVVGVVGHVRHWGLAIDDTAQVRAQLYYPFAQVPDRLLRRWSELMSIAVRSSVNPSNLVVPLRGELRGVAGDQVLYEINTMEQLARSTLDRQRFLLLLFGVFAGLSLLLACIGVYGVLAYLTNQRVPEIGVRLALGATAGDVMRTVLRESFGMIGLGVAAGASAAIAAAHILVRMVDGMQPAEPLTFVIMISVLVGAALLASFVPARRASRIDPTTALRED